MGDQWVSFSVTVHRAAITIVCPLSFFFQASQIKQQIVYFGGLIQQIDSNFFIVRNINYFKVLYLRMIQKKEWNGVTSGSAFTLMGSGK